MLGERTMHYRDVLAAIPKECYAKRPLRAWSALALNILLFVLTAAVIVKIHSFLFGALLGLTVLGLVATGFFVIGHDAGHRSFADSERVNDVVGHLTTSFLGWPFHLWRLAHNLHHLHTNHVKKDVAWEPHTREQIRRLPRFFRLTYSAVRSRLWFFWTGSAFHNLELLWKFLQGKTYRAEDRRKIWLSVIISVVLTSAYGAGSYALAGWYGLVTLFVLPQMGFYFWLTTFTLLHHTHPERRFLSDRAWNKVDAQLTGTLNIRYGSVVDFFTHDIAWHIPHHVSVGIPFYHLKAAHRALATAFPAQVTELSFSLAHLRSVLGTCQAIEDFEEARWVLIGAFSPSPAAEVGRAEPAQA